MPIQICHGQLKAPAAAVAVARSAAELLLTTMVCKKLESGIVQRHALL